MNPTLGRYLAGALLFSMTYLASAAELVYDNSINDQNFDLDPGPEEVGDEIFLDGTARWLSEFTFEYWGNSESPTEFTGTVEARIRFYLNDGPALPGVDDAFLPGTIFYDTGSFLIDPTPRATLTFTNFVIGTVVPLTGPLPDAFTWSVQFTGMDPTDSAGVTVYSPPTVGGSLDDYWVNEAGGWTLQTNTLPVDFAARMSAELIPEPSARLLGLGGGLAALLVGWRRRGTISRA